METNAILVALEEGKTIVFFRSIEPRYYMKKGNSLFYSDDISNKDSWIKSKAKLNSYNFNESKFQIV